MGIEPTSEAWETLNKTLKAIELAALSFPREGLSWKQDGNGIRTPAFFEIWGSLPVTQAAFGYPDTKLSLHVKGTRVFVQVDHLNRY